MKQLGILIKELRGTESLRNASERIGISHSYLYTIENGYNKKTGKPVKPTPETLKLISVAYNYPYKKLMQTAGYIEGETDPVKVSKDEKDIAKLLEEIRNDLEHTNGLAFYGEPLSEEAKEFFLKTIDVITRHAKKINTMYTLKNQSTIC